MTKKSRARRARDLEQSAPGGDVFLAYLHPNEVAASFHRSLIDLVQWDQTRQHHLRTWAAVRAAPWGLDDARNTCVKAMLDTPCEWLLFVDADMGFHPWVVDQLVSIADPETRPIVGGLCFAYKEEGQDGTNGFHLTPRPTIYDFVEVDGETDFRGRLHYPVNQLVQTAATGCAMVIIHRSVLEAVRDKWGETWFDRLPSPKGMRGEDISFFMRTAALEIPTFVHTGVRTTHMKSTWVGEELFWDAWMPDPATELVDVIVPTVKARVGNLERLARSLYASTGLARLIFVVDDDEHAAEAKQWGEVVVEPGTFAHKINAVYPETTAPWIQVVGDDCVFRPGWLDHSQQTARLYGAKVVGSNDLANPRVLRGEHATHWMIARDYIDEVGASWDGPGVIAHEGYHHWFVDDEIVTAARGRGVFQMALGAKIEHIHPITGKVATDEVYEANDAHAAVDKLLFERRARQNR